LQVSFAIQFHISLALMPQTTNGTVVMDFMGLGSPFVDSVMVIVMCLVLEGYFT